MVTSKGRAKHPEPGLRRFEAIRPWNRTIWRASACRGLSLPCNDHHGGHALITKQTSVRWPRGVAGKLRVGREVHRIRFRTVRTNAAAIVGVALDLSGNLSVHWTEMLQPSTFGVSAADVIGEEANEPK